MDYITQKLVKWGISPICGSFDREFGRYPQNILAKMTLEIRITRRYMDYNTRKLAKWGVYLLRSFFDFENGSISPSDQPSP
ncbi:hypothetical protein H5410_056541 [Solanum commersonii]|uniref:Uncharacterized protein n=1 Tax=Solanum commersonii TaxID=4109 RepID=A0A9J5WMH2_SOLCO|nr:hypothetical protein H5410_056541 [Solanum commersonii]